ncbi:hypothetical protein ACFQ1I_16815 [Kitasatospora arboriphila]
MVTAHEVAAGPGALTLRLPDGTLRPLGPDAAELLPELGLALLHPAADGPPGPDPANAPAAPAGALPAALPAALPIAQDADRADGRPLALLRPTAPDGTPAAPHPVGLASRCTAVLVLPEGLHAVPGTLVLAVPPQAVLPGTPVLDTTTGAVLAVLAPALRGERPDTVAAAPLIGTGLHRLLRRNAESVPAHGTALNLGGVLQLAAAQLHSAAPARPGRPSSPPTAPTGPTASPARNPTTCSPCWSAPPAADAAPNSPPWPYGAARAPARCPPSGCAAPTSPPATPRSPTRSPAPSPAPRTGSPSPPPPPTGPPASAPTPPARCSSCWTPPRRPPPPPPAPGGPPPRPGSPSTASGCSPPAAPRPGTAPTPPSAAPSASARCPPTPPPVPPAGTAPRRPPSHLPTPATPRRCAPPANCAPPACTAHRPSRGELYAAHLDLVCLRAARRIRAAEDRRPGAHRRGAPPLGGEDTGRLRRTAAALAGRVHEAARLLLGASHAGLTAAEFEHLFPAAAAGARPSSRRACSSPPGTATGWPARTTPTGCRAATWTSTAPSACCSTRAPPPRPLRPSHGDPTGHGVPRHRLGPVAAALRRCAENGEEAALAGHLQRLQHTLATAAPGSEAAWWAARLLAAVLPALPRPGAHRALLARLATTPPSPPPGGPPCRSTPPSGSTCCAASSAPNRPAGRTGPRPPRCSPPTRSPCNRCCAPGSPTPARSPTAPAPPSPTSPTTCCTPTAGWPSTS